MITKPCEICNAVFETDKSIKTCSKACSYKLRQLTRKKQHDPVEKICAACSNVFLDDSKKKLVKKCKKCISSAMVEKRKANGSYSPTEEQRKLRSQAMLEKHKLGKHFTDASKALLSSKAKERWESEEFKARCRQNSIEKYGVSHWTQTEQGRKKIGDRAKKYRASEETKMKLRLAAAKRLREGRHSNSFFGKGGFREDIGFYVRSKWEANFARYLLHTKQEFQYEPDSFLLPDGRTYTPDFKVGDVYYEIKGWWTSTAKEKYQLFCEQYQNVSVQIVDEVMYRKLVEQYAPLIAGWEH